MSRRVLLGKFPDGGYGLRVSKPGYDVWSNPVDNTQLQFNSDWGSILPVYQTGSLLVPGGFSNANNNYGNRGGGAVKTVTFPTLGYVPFVVVKFKWDTDTAYHVLGTGMADVWSGVAGTTGFTWLEIKVTSGQFTAQYGWTDTSAIPDQNSITLAYAILRQRAI